jgi:hypothetical protein
VIASDDWIVIENAFVAVIFGELLSVTVTLKLDVPRAVGVPLIVPLLDSVSPAGNVPEDRDHVSGGAIVGAADSVCEYAELITPPAREDVVISVGTSILRDLLSSLGGLLLSLTRTVNENTPDTDGVPLIPPLLADRVKPVGSTPEAIDHATGKRPPVELN